MKFNNVLPFLGGLDVMGNATGSDRLRIEEVHPDGWMV